MQAALDTVVPYACERSQFGQPIGTFQMMEVKEGVEDGWIDRSIDMLFQNLERARSTRVLCLFSLSLPQAKLADMYTSTTASRNLVMGIAAHVDHMTKEEAGSPALARDCAAAILFTAESATQVALQAIQVGNGRGLSDDQGGEERRGEWCRLSLHPLFFSLLLPDSGRQWVHERLPHRPLAARRQALRDRRGHVGDSKDDHWKVDGARVPIEWGDLAGPD